MKKYIIILFSMITFASGIAIGQIKPIKRGQKPNTEKTKTKSSKQSKGKGQVKSPSKTNTINVYSEEQFLKALGSNRTIVLQNSLNLSNIIDYNLVLSGYRNLTIIGKNSSISLIVSTTTVTILSFESCDNITISDLNMGHAEEGNNGCSEGVLVFTDCSRVNLSNCDIYGCGWFGVRFNNTHNVDCINSVIHDCDYDMFEINNSSNIKIKNTVFNESWTGTMIRASESRNIQFVDCIFVDKNNTEWDYYPKGCFDLNCNITLTNCTIRTTSAFGYGDTNFINQSRCKWYNGKPSDK